MTVLDKNPQSQTPMPPTSLRCSPESQSSPLSAGRNKDLNDELMEGSNDESTADINRFNSEYDETPAKVVTSLRKQLLGTTPPSRGRRKSRWKLKFHHQALPPEYLKHYKQQEKKRRLTETKKVIIEKVKARKSLKMSNEGVETLPVETILELVDKNGDEGDDNLFSTLDCGKSGSCAEPDDGKNDITRLDGLWPTPNLLDESFPHLNIDLSQNKAFLENLLSNRIEINRVDRSTRNAHPPVKQAKPKKARVIPPSGKIMNYSDLPYMGEITLDGIKPRRGRKPKKADICHLIYKNYGQIFPGAPNSVVDESATKCAKWKSSPTSPTQATSSSNLQVNTPVSPIFHPQSESPLPTVSGLINHTEVQNRIINSLLERRLTQEIKNKAAEALNKSEESTEEPLNLCLRDLKSLKIKLSRKHGNIYEAKSPEVLPKVEIEVKKEIIDLESEDDSSIDDSDLTPFNLVTTELREYSDEDSCVSLGSNVTLSKIPEKLRNTRDVSILPSSESSLFWPGNNFMTSGGYSSMPLLPGAYYQKLNSLKAQQLEKKAGKMTKPKSPMKRLSQKVNNNSNQTMTKRKRSAIFIPPVPAENTTNPTTEVSICKFKFTGGAKPSLQEKKMLSVDSGGNFRYYSGTGDKSMRGYEYFPRESLQQCQENTGCSPSGVFLTASALGSGEKIPEDVGHSGFFDPSFPFQLTSAIPETKNKQKKAENSEMGFSALREQLTDSLDGDDDDDDSDNSNPTTPSSANDALRDDRMRGDDMPVRRARKSRKSLAREKLEQTFKEKGFLIQTQQLESAEGATYCKFRQLRKFTRYLFRSWKDYLPGNVRDLSVDAGVCLQPDAAIAKMDVTDS